MAPSRIVQSLIFLVREEEADSEEETSSVKAFALLPHNLKIGLKIREVFSKNQIRVFRNRDDLSPPLWQESDHVEMIEVFFDEADVTSEAKDQSKLSLAYDTCNEGTIQLLFGSDFCFKRRNDSILSVFDGSLHMFIMFKQLFTFTAEIGFVHSKGGTLLLFLLDRGHFDLFELLLKRGANASAANNDGLTPLHVAAINGYVRPAFLLLHYGASLSAKATSDLMRDSTPLHCAVVCEHAYLVKFFLQCGADINAEDNNGTVLLQAVRTQDENMVKTVLQYRPSVSEPGNRRALYEAVFGSSKNILELLVRIGGFRIEAGEEDERKLLCHAIAKDCQLVVQQLIDGGVALNDGYEIPPLHLAAQYGLKDVVKLLLAAGADPNMKASDEQTPLIYALEAGQFILDEKAAWVARFIVDILVENGADIKTKDSKGRRACDLEVGGNAEIHVLDFQGRTAFHKAAARGNVKAIQKLLKCRRNVNTRCKEGKTPLMYAADEGWIDSHSWDDVTRPPSPLGVEHYSARNSKLFAVIVNGGGNINARCSKGRSPLSYAVGKPRFIDIRDLLDLGAYIEARDHSGKTPLHIAAENGFVVFIEALIHNGADVDARCAKGKTPLMYAAGKDHFDAVLTLLLHDARVDIVSCSGRTALDEAYEGWVAKLLETLLYYCFTDQKFLVASVRRPIVHPKRPWFGGRLNQRFQPSKPQEFDTVYERHVVRTKATVPSACLVRTPAFKTEGISDFKGNVEAERELMKTLPVGDTNISFYDVLMYSSNQLASAVKNDSFVKAMEQLDYKKKIPMFVDIVQLKLQRACRRRKLLDCRSKIFKLFCPKFSGLPDELQERIVSFLSNSDLARLQLACTRILTLSSAKGRARNRNKPYTPLCCSTRPPRVLCDDDDRDFEPIEPYWLSLTRMRL